jgi:uncharacterized membrane protein YdbT with pleckstrin-like domain
MGSYVRNNLISGESVVYETRLHWVVFLSLRSLLTLGILPLIESATSEFAITTKRVIVKLGLISRHTLELNLQRVESVSVEQTLFGRMLGYGTITIIGTGGTREPFHRIADPLGFRRAVEEQLSLLPVYRA